MLALILLIIFGLGTALFATQNTGMVHITIANYLMNGIPMYVVVICSLLLGVFISWLVSLVDSISSTFTMYGKDSEIKKAHKTIDNLREEIHDLQGGNNHAKEITKNKKNLMENEEYAPSFVEGLKDAFS